MSDEQYIDELFAREGLGWEKTPGFRDFVLDLMSETGTRPRAGDVCSMHLAYKAGLEHGREWTDERPTEPGKYWLSFAPDKRIGESAVIGVLVDGCDRLLVFLPRGNVAQTTHSMFDGAKWSRRENPADPFEVTK